MAGKSQAHTDDYLNAFRGTQMPAFGANTYVALLTTNPSDDAMTGAVEASYAGYSRQPIATSAAGWNAPAAGAGSTRQITNASQLNMGTKTDAGTVTITGWALCKTSGTSVTTAGEVIRWGALAANKVINQNDPVTVAAGNVVINED